MSKFRVFILKRISTETKRFWVIQNSKPLLQKLDKINLKKGAKDISTFDFSTLYTKLPHTDLIKILQDLVEFVFNGGRKTADGNRKYLTVRGKDCFFSRGKHGRNCYTLRAQRRLDPAYEAAFQAANDAIDRAQVALDAALAENADHIADLEDRAVKLPDGRAVFVRADGSGETADGEIIPAEVMDTLNVPDDAPTDDEYNAARERRRELGECGDEIDHARKTVNDPDNPADKDDLDTVRRWMDDLTRKIENVPEMSEEFAQAASSPVSERAASISLPSPIAGQ